MHAPTDFPDRCVGRSINTDRATQFPLFSRIETVEGSNWHEFFLMISFAFRPCRGGFAAIRSNGACVQAGTPGIDYQMAHC
jgi:hypothetical protein